MLPTFEQFRSEVLENLDKWAKLLRDNRLNDAALLKEETEDLISGWKSGYNFRKGEISNIIAAKLADIFGKDDK